jgi:23S rRNA pseudouridine1911/1915/1917 synthase
MQTEFIISAGEQPKRLDVFLVQREPKLSRAALQRMITAGWVRVNNHIAKSSQRIRLEMSLSLILPSQPHYASLARHSSWRSCLRIMRVWC